MDRYRTYLTGPQLARLAGVSRPTAWRWVHSGKFGPAKKTSGSSRLRVAVSEIEHMLGVTYTDAQVADALAYASSSKPRGSAAAAPRLVQVVPDEAAVRRLLEDRDAEWRDWLASRPARAIYPKGPPIRFQ